MDKLAFFVSAQSQNLLIERESPQRRLSKGKIYGTFQS